MRDAVRNSSHSRTGGRGDSEAVPLPRGAKAGGDLEVLSDTQGVDFSDYLKHFHRDVMRNWLPLLPEEIYPPLSKQGETYILLTILPDGTIGDMKLEGSSHDDAINRSAWGSITSEGKFPQLPSKFHGPNLILRLHYVIGEDLQ